MGSKNRLSANITSILQLTDTPVPGSFTNNAGKILIVNNAENAMEFGEIAGTNLAFLDDQTVYNCNPAVEINDFVYLFDETTAAVADKAQPTNLPIIGAVVSKPSTSSCTIQTLGYLDGFTGLVAGSKYFLGSNGKITNVPTTTPGEVHYPIGVAKSSTRLEIFNTLTYVLIN